MFLPKYGGEYKLCRPRLNHWHFNDGSMVLPDGLIILSKDSDFSETENSTTSLNKTSHNWFNYKTLNVPLYQGDSLEITDPDMIIAIRVIGVTKEYRLAGKPLDMEVF